MNNLQLKENKHFKKFKQIIIGIFITLLCYTFYILNSHGSNFNIKQSKFNYLDNHTYIDKTIIVGVRQNGDSVFVITNNGDFIYLDKDTSFETICKLIN